MSFFVLDNVFHRLLTMAMSRMVLLCLLYGALKVASLTPPWQLVTRLQFQAGLVLTLVLFYYSVSVRVQTTIL